MKKLLPEAKNKKAAEVKEEKAVEVKEKKGAEEENSAGAETDPAAPRAPVNPTVSSGSSPHSLQWIHGLQGIQSFSRGLLRGASPETETLLPQTQLSP